MIDGRMNNDQKKIDGIIEQFFEKSFFLSDSMVTREKIDTVIKKFECKYPLLSKHILVGLKKNFPLARIENWTHFFNHDRCAKFLIQITEELRFVCQVSIFHFFSVYQHSAHKIDGRFQYGEITFINQHESAIADIIYSCLGDAVKEFIWLDKELLNEVVKDFSILDDDPLFRFEIKVADIIFTDHYL